MSSRTESELASAERVAVLAWEAALLRAPILIWRFEEAPAELRALSRNGGDEDWVALVHPSLAQEGYGPPHFLDTSPFAITGDPETIPLPGGGMVVIASHA